MSSVGLGAVAENYYAVECHEYLHPDGSVCRVPANLRVDLCPFAEHTPRLKWSERITNLMTTVGKNKLLDATLKTGLASPAWYVGLVTSTGFTAYAAADTMASHTGWTESAAYSNATRPAFTPGSIAGGSVDNSASKATFNINATDTIRGAFMADNSTVSGTSGTLYGEGDFAAARATLSGDTVTAQLTCTVS